MFPFSSNVNHAQRLPKNSRTCQLRCSSYIQCNIHKYYIQFFCYGCCVYIAKNKTACSTTKFSPLLLLLLPNLPFRYSFVRSFILLAKLTFIVFYCRCFFFLGGSSASATITRLPKRWWRAHGFVRSRLFGHFNQAHTHTYVLYDICCCFHHIFFL